METRKYLVLLSIVIFIFSLINPALASKYKDVESQITESKSKLNSIYERYNKESNRLEELNERISLNEAKLEKANIELKKDEEIFNKRLNQIYRNKKIDLVDTIMSSATFRQFVVSLDFANRISDNDAFSIKKVKELKAKIKKAQESLHVDRKEQKFLVGNLESQKNTMENELDRQKDLLSQIEEDVRNAALPGGGSSAYSLNIGSFVFPAQGPYSFYNDWGQPRGGGSRTHKGTDIMSSYNNEAYAVVSGYISVGDGGAGGLWITLHGDDGNQYWYMHMASYAVTSGHVEAGQVIGYIGDSGNAKGGPPHIHFEFHPGGGAAVNPYPLLSAAG